MLRNLLLYCIYTKSFMMSNLIIEYFGLSFVKLNFNTDLDCIISEHPM